jgi:two-component system, OmpR family, phosphate regulon response regulator PhoB
MTSHVQTVLVIEDEADIADLVTFNLERSGYRTLKEHDGQLGLATALKERPNLIILDLMLPTINGLAVLKGLKRDARTEKIPVILLTARAQTEDRIQGLASGADDYVTKPFSPKELLLRVNAILKRLQSATGGAEFSEGKFRFDKNSLKFYIENEPIELTSTEFKLLLFLCERANYPQQRNDILRSVWGYSDDVISRTLDTHMKRLRSKLGQYSDQVETIRGIGYRYINSPT